jgi:hypothetical protein
MFAVDTGSQLIAEKRTSSRTMCALLTFSLMINLGAPGPGVADGRTGCESAIATGSARQHLAYAGGGGGFFSAAVLT